MVWKTPVYITSFMSIMFKYKTPEFRGQERRELQFNKAFTSTACLKSCWNEIKKWKKHIHKEYKERKWDQFVSAEKFLKTDYWQKR